MAPAQNREAFHIFFYLFLAAVKPSNTPPTSTTSIPNYNFNLASKPVVTPPPQKQQQQQQQQSSKNQLHLIFKYFFIRRSG